ncbi:hypothetical protein C4553_00575 [Candidatus Parcubacteria bacterium]|nr:MAG: hypothetical protein C4553_00575 [Candidatus Parcubacteria bacterium]
MAEFERVTFEIRKYAQTFRSRVVSADKIDKHLKELKHQFKQERKSGKNPARIEELSAEIERFSRYRRAVPLLSQILRLVPQAKFKLQHCAFYESLAELPVPIPYSQGLQSTPMFVFYPYEDFVPVWINFHGEDFQKALEIHQAENERQAMVVPEPFLREAMQKGFNGLVRVGSYLPSGSYTIHPRQERKPNPLFYFVASMIWHERAHLVWNDMTGRFPVGEKECNESQLFAFNSQLELLEQFHRRGKINLHFYRVFSQTVKVEIAGLTDKQEILKKEALSVSSSNND